MNKKIVLTAILASFIMIGVSLVSAVNTQTKEKQKKLEKVDSPLFKIRTGKAIAEEKTTIKNKIRNIITNFLENRVFLVFPMIKKFIDYKNNNIELGTQGQPATECPTGKCLTCSCNMNNNEDAETYDVECTYFACTTGSTYCIKCN